MSMDHFAFDDTHTHSASSTIATEVSVCTLINILSTEWSSMQGTVTGVAAHVVLQKL